MKALGYTFVIIGSALVAIGTRNKNIFISTFGVILVIIGVSIINGKISIP